MNVPFFSDFRSVFPPSHPEHNFCFRKATPTPPRRRRSTTPASVDDKAFVFPLNALQEKSRAAEKKTTTKKRNVSSGAAGLQAY